MPSLVWRRAIAISFHDNGYVFSFPFFVLRTAVLSGVRVAASSASRLLLRQLSNGLLLASSSDMRRAVASTQRRRYKHVVLASVSRSCRMRSSKSRKSPRQALQPAHTGTPARHCSAAMVSNRSSKSKSSVMFSSTSDAGAEKMNSALFASCAKIYFDIETTGFFRKPKPWTGYPDEIVQICASARGRTFSSYVRPAVSANYSGLKPGKSKRSAHDVHGIGPDDVSHAETWRNVGAQFWRFVEDVSAPGKPVVLVAYNGWASHAFIPRVFTLKGISFSACRRLKRTFSRPRMCAEFRCRFFSDGERHVRSERSPGSTDFYMRSNQNRPRGLPTR